MTTELNSVGYVPHDKQQVFHQDTHRCRWFCAGVGTGKTAAGVIEALYQAWINHPGKNGIMLAPTFPLLEQGIIETWRKLVPSELYRINAHQNIIYLKNGSKIYCRSTQNIESYRGINAAWAYFDEPASEPNKRAFDEILDRLRAPAPGKKVSFFMTGTPNGSAHWTARVFGTGPGNGFKGTDSYWFNKDFAVIRAATWDNPIFPKNSDYIQQLINRSDSTDEWISQQVEARFVSRTGLVFTQFKDHHIVDKLPSKFKAVYAGFDFGFSSAGAITLLGETHDGRFYCFKEEYHKNLLCDESGWFKIIDQLHSEHHLNWIVCDSASPERIEALRRYLRHRPIVYESEKDTLGSIRRMQKLFHENRMFIHNSCETYIQELRNWSWKTHPTLGALDTPQDGNDHCIDSQRYIISLLSI